MTIPRSRSSSTEGKRSWHPPLGFLVVRVRARPMGRALVVPLPLGFGLELLRGLELLLQLPFVDRPLRRWLGSHGARAVPVTLAGLPPWVAVRVGQAFLERAIDLAPFSLVEVEAPDTQVKVGIV